MDLIRFSCFIVLFEADVKGKKQNYYHQKCRPWDGENYKWTRKWTTIFYGHTEMRKCLLPFDLVLSWTSQWKDACYNAHYDYLISNLSMLWNINQCSGTTRYFGLSLYENENDFYSPCTYERRTTYRSLSPKIDY